MIKYVMPLLSAVLVSCGGGVPDVPAETHLANAEAYAASVEETVGKKLSYRSLSGYSRGDSEWNLKIGYLDNKPATIYLGGAGSNQLKWWLYPDSATGKILYFKEEAPLDGRMQRNRFAYRGDSLALALGGNEPYTSPYGNIDFRLKAKEVDALLSEVVKAVESDIKSLSAEANAARKENAQIYATGGGKAGWHLVVNPSTSVVTFTEAGSTEARNFGYDGRPATGAGGESIYSFGSLQGKMEVSIASKSCNIDGRTYPYTVIIKVDDKTLSGCGTLLQ